SSDSDEAAQYGGGPKPVSFVIHHGGCFTPTPSRSYIGGQVSSFDVVDIDEFCLHDLKEMVVKLGYGVAYLMYYHFFRPRLGLDYGLHPLTIDVDVLELANSPNVNKNLIPMCSINLTQEWEDGTSKALSIGEVMKKLSKQHPTSVDKGPIVEETPTVEENNPFDDLNEILGDYANTGKEIIRKEFIVHVDGFSVP
ncbi:hypothetical protein Tco_0887040, partial [Tanacetum coccineum]